MLDRYSRPKMRSIWSEENKYAAWLEVELLACEAWGELGHIPKDDIATLKKNAKIDINRINEIEQETRHDVIAFTRALSETLGPERKWVHYGLTSTDVVDTALGSILKMANAELKSGVEDVIQTLRKLAVKHKHTVMMGRTHGVHAEPTTLGLKFALWHEEMKRNLKRLTQSAEMVEVGKISGAVGTYANVESFIEEYVTSKLNFQYAPISTQTLQRDRHADYISTLALIATSLDKFSTEIRALQKSEIRELEEGFAKGQKGSSAMPHKINPISSENVSGLARVLRGYVIPALEDVVLWHERDISHSSVERIILPDATMLLDYMLNRFNNTLNNLNVYPEHMKRNLEATFGLPFSGRLLTMLIDKGLARETAYDTIQPLAMQAWEQRMSFKAIVISSSTIRRHLELEDIDDAFDSSWFVKNVDAIFKRLNLN